MIIGNGLDVWFYRGYYRGENHPNFFPIGKSEEVKHNVICKVTRICAQVGKNLLSPDGSNQLSRSRIQENKDCFLLLIYQLIGRFQFLDNVIAPFPLTRELLMQQQTKENNYTYTSDFTSHKTSEYVITPNTRMPFSIISICIANYMYQPVSFIDDDKCSF